MIRFVRILAIGLALAAAAAAQAPPGNDCTPPRPPRMHGGMMRGGPAMGIGPGMGKWWNNPAMAQRLGLTEAQVQQMEKAFRERRDKLVEMRNSLDGLEAKLEPMIAMSRLDEAQITSQIDKIAQARATLEKLNSLMLLDLRRALSAEQWRQLQQQRIGPHAPGSQGAAPPPTAP